MIRRLGANTIASGVILAVGMAGSVFAQLPGSGSGNTNIGGCDNLPKYATLKTALDAAVTAETSGLDLPMWATIVDRDGIVCAVAFSGANRGSQWPGSRVISAQKANTANSFSLQGGTGSKVFAKGLALSTANLFSATQPGGSLYGLQESNPVDVTVAYKGPSSSYGQDSDPMVGSKIGGVNVFGGGFALYSSGGTVVGGVGVSGDTSCADHNIGWRVRHNLNLDYLSTIAGVSGDASRPDNIVFDIAPTNGGGVGASAGGFGHPKCLNTSGAEGLPQVQ